MTSTDRENDAWGGSAVSPVTADRGRDRCRFCFCCCCCCCCCRGGCVGRVAFYTHIAAAGSKAKRVEEAHRSLGSRHVLRRNHFHGRPAKPVVCVGGQNGENHKKMTRRVSHAARWLRQPVKGTYREGRAAGAKAAAEERQRRERRSFISSWRSSLQKIQLVGPLLFFPLSSSPLLLSPFPHFFPAFLFIEF